MQSNTNADMATPPSRCASPSRPTAVVPTMPSSGVVRFASIAGPAMAKTRALVTTLGGAVGSAIKGARRPSAFGRAHEAHDQPNRHHHGGAEQKVPPEPAYDVEAHIPDAQHERLETLDDVPGVEPKHFQDHADQDRQQDEPENDRERRTAEEAVEVVIVGHRPLRRQAHGSPYHVARFAAGASY